MLEMAGALLQTKFWIKPFACIPTEDGASAAISLVARVGIDYDLHKRPRHTF
jgi:hypothetical protein